jgi:hypothetical protein
MTGQGIVLDNVCPNVTTAMGCALDSASASGSCAHSTYETSGLAVVSDTRRAVMVDCGTVVDFTVALPRCRYRRS